jgi:hypothetical protein
MPRWRPASPKVARHTASKRTFTARRREGTVGGVSAERDPILSASSRETALTTDSTQSAPHLECQLAHIKYQLLSRCGVCGGDASSECLPVLAFHAASSKRAFHAVGAKRVPSLPLAG